MVCELTDHDELWIRSEGGFQGDSFTVVVALHKTMHRWDKERAEVYRVVLWYDALDHDETGTDPHPKWVQHGSFEGIKEAESTPIGGDENQFPIVAKLQPSPFACAVILQLKGGERALEEIPAVKTRKQMHTTFHNYTLLSTTRFSLTGPISTQTIQRQG